MTQWLKGRFSSLSMGPFLSVLYLCVSNELKLITLIKYGSWFCRTQQTPQHINNIYAQLRIKGGLSISFTINHLICKMSKNCGKCSISQSRIRKWNGTRNLHACGSSWMFVVCLKIHFAPLSQRSLNISTQNRQLFLVQPGGKAKGHNHLSPAVVTLFHNISRISVQSCSDCREKVCFAHLLDIPNSSDL